VLRFFPFIKPCLPSSRLRPPSGDAWLHEIKLDGWRGQLHKCGGEVRLYSKRGNDLSGRFSDLVRAVARMPIGNVILDGEITALDSHGLPDFGALQKADKNSLQSFWAFDLLRVGDEDLRSLALEERKAKLQKLCTADIAELRYSESFDDAEALLKVSTRMGLEGIVSKKRDTSYRSGPSKTWLKIKTSAWREANRERWKLFERQA
jgi:bifunctional non-homologous end joining protein LigD